jgi:hypothetical protein
MIRIIDDRTVQTYQGEQNRCRPGLEGYLSSLQNLALAVACSETLGHLTAMPFSRETIVPATLAACPELTETWRAECRDWEEYGAGESPGDFTNASAFMVCIRPECVLWDGLFVRHPEPDRFSCGRGESHAKNRPPTEGVFCSHELTLLTVPGPRPPLGVLCALGALGGLISLRNPTRLPAATPAGVELFSPPRTPGATPGANRSHPSGMKAEPRLPVLGRRRDAPLSRDVPFPA